MKALEQALARFPASTPERWDRIAEAVPGKTRPECVARFKQIVAALKAKKDPPQFDLSQVTASWMTTLTLS